MDHHNSRQDDGQRLISGQIDFVTIATVSPQVDSEQVDEAGSNTTQPTGLR